MKFVIVATLFLAMLAGCFAASLTGSGSQLSPSGIIQQLIGQYEQRYQGPSVIHPEEVAHVIDVNNLHI